VSGAGIDLDINKTIFVGGGSILLKDYIQKSQKVKRPVFVTDIKANVKGFSLIYHMTQAAQGAQRGDVD